MLNDKAQSFVPSGLGRRWFQNVSGKRVPPYAIMQIVGDPAAWKERQKDNSLSQYQKDLAKLDGLLHDVQHDNTNLLFCDQPNSVSEIYQDAGIMAFNGPAWVEKDAIGRCSTGAFPSLCIAIGNAPPSAIVSFATVKGKWFLVPEYTDFGAFSCLTATGELVGLQDDPQAGTVYAKNARVMVTTARANNRFVLPITQADIRMQGTTPAAFVNVRPLFSFVAGNPVQVDLNSSFFEEDGSLVINVPGMYEVVITDTLVVDRALASDVNRVPVSLSLVAQPSGNMFYLSDPERVVRGSSELFRLEDSPSAGPVPVDGTEVPTENPTKFARMQFIYKDIIEIRNGPTKLFLQNTGSPYVNSKTESVGNVKVRAYDLFRELAQASFANAYQNGLGYPGILSNLLLNTFYAADSFGNLLVKHIDSDLDEWI